MIIYSRDRNEAYSGAIRPETIAKRLNTEIVSIPFLYDLRAFGSTVRMLREIKEPSVLFASMPERTIVALLEFLEVPFDRCRIVELTTATDEMPPWPELEEAVSQPVPGGRIRRLEEPTVRRWYPIIDRKECTGCLECVNFCLFGVYSIDAEERPFVDQPDACRDGCPACSRVCPGAAILFPLHEDPMICGRYEAEVVRSQQHSDQATEERRRHLEAESSSRDELDDLVDQVDQFSPH